MRIYCNRLPIHFGEQGIPCLSHGYFEDKAPPSCFAHRGQYLAWLDDPLDSDATSQVTWLHPLDLDGQIQAYLLAQLRDLLAKTGTALLSADHVSYQAQGHTTLVSIELDLVQATISLLLSPQPATELPSPDKLKASISALSGMALGAHARIGAWEPISVEPNELPDLLFSADGTQHHTVAAEGISAFGPLSRNTARFAQPIHIVWIARKQQSSTMSNFLQDFLGGMKGTYEAENNWGLGWEKTYHLLQGAHLHPLQIDDYASSIREQIKDLLERLKAEGKEVSMLLYEKEDIHPRLEVFCLHRVLACHRIPTTDFVPRGSKRALLLEVLGIVLYAKLGGTPWLLPLPQTLHRQYVAGIGSVDEGDGTLGYATIFSAQGDYHLGDAAWAPSHEAWNKGLAQFITNQVNRLYTQGEFRQGDQVDILFHLDRPWAEMQRLAVKEALQAAFGGKFVLQITFVHLGFDHPYHLWQEPMAPAPAGTLHTLGDCRRLLQLGDSDASSPPQRPVLATLLQGSDTGDFGFVCYQIHTFASLSWTGVHRSRLPATLLYGQHIASKISLLRAESPDLHIPDGFKSIPWYL